MVTAILNILLGVWSLVRMTISPPNLQQLDSALQQIDNPQFEQFIHNGCYLAYGPLRHREQYF